MTQTSPKKILIAPLDWGLGHTTRCIPLARHLLRLGAQIFFAGNDSQIAFFRKSLPQAAFLSLPGYEVRYAQTRKAFMPRLLRQIPGIFRKIQNEHQWLLREAEKQGFDGIFSDNRYGLWHPQIPSVFLTHQPGLKTGFGEPADKVFAHLHQRMMRHFSAVWLVDIPQNPGLSGTLAHPALIPEKAFYIGLLSQLEVSGNILSKSGIVILLSGPEPQRSLLSEKLWKESQKLTETPVVFIEGRADAPKREAISGNIRWFAQCSAAELSPLLQAAQYVVCRSGYSTLMDAVALALKLILIPTPGQTEQEYLGKTLFQQQKALCFRQENFNLENALKKVAGFPLLPLGNHEDLQQFVPVLENWYKEL